MTDIPLVSISCITFNHAPYLRECFDGFLMQQTDFQFEVVVHDDASTDGTREVIEEYTAKYPDIFVPMYQTENQYSQGVRGMMARFNFPRCRGKYIALCEGDDYWTDPFKLQKQVDFLEGNPDFVLCFHNAVVLNERTKKERLFIEKYNKLTYDGKDILFDWYIPTASMVCRNIEGSLPEYMKTAPHGDLGFQLYLLKFGKFRVLDEVMSVYRKSEHGITNSFNTLAYYKSYILQMENMNVYFNKIYSNQLKSNIFHAYSEIIKKRAYENNTRQVYYFLKMFTYSLMLEKLKSKELYLTFKSLTLNIIYGKKRK